MRRIHEALVRWRADHDGQLPNWLSDLVPQYLTTATLLCPADSTSGTVGRYGYPDPRMPCSYTYEFPPLAWKEYYESSRRTEAQWEEWYKKYGKTVREWKERQLKEFGNVVPTVRCMHHSKTGAYERVLNLSYDGRLYISPLLWEKGPREDFVTTQSGATTQPAPANAPSARPAAKVGATTASARRLGQ